MVLTPFFNEPFHFSHYPIYILRHRKIFPYITNYKIGIRESISHVIVIMNHCFVIMMKNRWDRKHPKEIYEWAISADEKVNS